MRIRPARADEVSALTELARRAKASWEYPPSWMEAWAGELRFTPESLEKWAVLVAEEDDVPVGVIALAQTGAGNGEIEHLWVDPEAHGRGIGRELLERGRDWARQKGVATLRVVSDPQARGFYERCGATVLGEEHAPMPGSEDRTLPVLRLDVEGESQETLPAPSVPADQLALLELVDRIEAKRKAARRHSLYALLGLSPAWILPMAGLAADFGIEIALALSVLIAGVESFRAIRAKSDLKEAEALQEELLRGDTAQLP